MKSIKELLPKAQKFTHLICIFFGGERLDNLFSSRCFCDKE